MKEINNIANGLWLCVAIFSFRVFGQIFVLLFDVPFLPPFSAWYSGVISYPFLLLFQFVILAVGVFCALKISRNQLIKRPKVGRALLFIAAIYFSVMFIRLGIGMSGWSQLTWFNRPIPSFFHLILAAYLFLIGKYHVSGFELKER